MEDLDTIAVEGHYWANFFFSYPCMKRFEHYCEDEHLRQMNNWKSLSYSLCSNADKRSDAGSAGGNDYMRISVPTPEFNMVFQLLHVMRHFFHDGIGLKQMIDYYWLINSEQIDIENVRKLIRKFGLTHIAEGMMWMMHNVLGMPKERLPFTVDEKVGHLLLKEIDRGGNLGYDDLGLHKWRFNSSLQMFAWRTYRDISLIRICPSEVLWSPLFRMWQKFWIRKMEKKYKL